MRLNDKGTINSYKITAKTHATMDKKFAIPLYAEHLHFLILRCGWRVSNERTHSTFEQSKLKKKNCHYEPSIKAKRQNRCRKRLL